MAIGHVWSILYLFIRPFIKWFLHKFTRLCELQRICYGAPSGSPRSRQVESSLLLSRRKEIKNLIKILDEKVEFCNDAAFRSFVIQAVNTVLVAKKIKPKLHPDFGRLFGNCVEQIWGYRRLTHEIERLRCTQYDCENLVHESKLLELWTLLMPDDKLEGRISKQWQEIGFQGDDPKTDFRGMGMLGLENLIYFAKEYNNAARHVLLHSNHPKHGYTFAIVGINLTSLAHRLLRSGLAKTHFYNVTKKAPTMNEFHKFYCYLFFEFDQFWLQSKPRSIMDFPIIHDKFEKNIIKLLDDDSSVFKMNFLVENV